mmetsp:Transcript_26439/g.32150  ORF Transcript_26439/g.32150 Transcript_26439/m.32150 type:complete len:81 (+) Transcript_26439:300-542(+)
MKKTINISSRGRKAKKPSCSFLNTYAKAQENIFHNETNPGGFISLTVAENTLMYDDYLKPKLVKLHHRYIPVSILSTFTT